VFFDRGIPELIGYSYLVNAAVSTACKEAAEKYRYNHDVFLAPPWEEIYQNDVERKQDFKEAVATYDAIKRAYLECGYAVIELPKVSVAERVNFILQAIKAQL
jgi:predicted ATPase